MLFTCAYQICTDFDYKVQVDIGFRYFSIGQQRLGFCPKISVFWLCRLQRKLLLSHIDKY